MSILACLAWANTAARVPLEPLMLYVATSSGPSPGKPRVASKTRAYWIARAFVMCVVAGGGKCSATVDCMMVLQPCGSTLSGAQQSEDRKRINAQMA
eukprot:scaffold1044_cov120-Isochrysis_galbana.AAC.3